jgi:purine-nucleoside phosphorylase
MTPSNRFTKAKHFTAMASTPDPEPPLRRGYSTFPPSEAPRVRGASTHCNVIIKKRLPARGIVSSNPKRLERLLQQSGHLLSDLKEHTNAGWGILIYTARYENVDMFLAAVPMGSAGSGFAFFEMFAAGAQAIIRYGSNDRSVQFEDLRDIVVVDEADNLTGFGKPDGPIPASSQLVSLLTECGQEKDCKTQTMVCHNVEDYHAYNFSELFVEEESAIQENIHQLEADSDRKHCADMETAALFWRASQFGGHASTVLQNLLKKPGTSPYEGEHGKISLAMEHTFYQVIFNALSRFSPKQVEETTLEPNKIRRAYRRHTSNDFIGHEEPLVGIMCEAKNVEEEKE